MLFIFFQDTGRIAMIKRFKFLFLKTANTEYVVIPIG